MKRKIMDIKAMIFFFAKDCQKIPKNSLKIVICTCKWKFGSTTFHCSNSVMHELWTLNCLSNERSEAYLSIHVHLIIKKIYDYDSKKLHWIPVSFILGHTVYCHALKKKLTCKKKLTPAYLYEPIQTTNKYNIILKSNVSQISDNLYMKVHPNIQKRHTLAL